MSVRRLLSLSQRPIIGHRVMLTTPTMQSNENPPRKHISEWADKKTGEFNRQASVFRNSIPSDEFPAEAGRYHLYVSYACPWAHRVLIVRKLKGLESILPFTSVHWHMGEKGWRYATPLDDPISGHNVTADPVHPDYTHLRQIYFDQNPDYTGRFTVPVIYDKIARRIVNNESSEIIRMLYNCFDHLLPAQYADADLFPKAYQVDINETNAWTYEFINNGVYRSGFATSQEAYDSAVVPLFENLDRAERHLASQHANSSEYYFGNSITEADIRLFTTIIRFDAVYVARFRCNIRDIRSGYPAIHRWVRNLYWNHSDAFGPTSSEADIGTTDWEHIKGHYFNIPRPAAKKPASESNNSTSTDPSHAKYMQQAISESRKVNHQPSNYSVGALIVSPSSQDPVITASHTWEFDGNTHAEENCLFKLSQRNTTSLPTDAVLYTTLEPCAARLSGKQNCVDRLLEAREKLGGLNTMYYGYAEPDVHFKENLGRKRLEAAGVKVVHVPGFEKEIAAISISGHAKKEPSVAAEEERRKEHEKELGDRVIIPFGPVPHILPLDEEVRAVALRAS